jgi:hypothetical protein
MEKRIIDGVEVQRSSGNVYADLGLADAEKLKIKTGLVIEIRRAMHSRPRHSECIHDANMHMKFTHQNNRLQSMGYANIL